MIHVITIHTLVVRSIKFIVQHWMKYSLRGWSRRITACILVHVSFPKFPEIFIYLIILPAMKLAAMLYNWQTEKIFLSKLSNFYLNYRKEIHLWEHKYILFIVFYTCCIFFFLIDGEVLEKYRSRLRELLVGVSQRLEMAVESRSRSNLFKNLCNICNTTHFFHSELLLPSSCFLMFVFSLQT